MYYNYTVYTPWLCQSDIFQSFPATKGAGNWCTTARETSGNMRANVTTRRGRASLRAATDGLISLLVITPRAIPHLENGKQWKFEIWMLGQITTMKTLRSDQRSPVNRFKWATILFTALRRGINNRNNVHLFAVKCIPIARCSNQTVQKKNVPSFWALLPLETKLIIQYKINQSTQSSFRQSITFITDIKVHYSSIHKG